MASKKPLLRIILGAGNIGDTSKDPLAKFGTPEEVEKFLDYFYDRGYDSLDTARAYSPGARGTSEALLGAVDAGKRFNIDTKILPHAEEHPHAKANIERNVNESLEALRVSQVDVEYLHAPDRTTPFEETCEAMNKAYLEGKFRSPAAAGFFAGKHRDAKPGGRYDTLHPLGQLYASWYVKPNIISAVDRALATAEKFGISGHAAALRWTFYHGILHEMHSDAIIIGASSTTQLGQNLDIVEEGPLPKEVAEAMNDIYPELAGDEVSYHF